MNHIIFDVDGTLWDSTESVARSWNRAIRENTDLDLTIDGPLLSSLFGKTMEEIYLALFPDLSPEERNRIGDLCYEYENESLESDPGILYDGVAEYFPKLAESYRLYIVSNCQCGYIEAMLKASGLAPYVQDTLCYGQTLTSKGQTIRTLMKRNHLDSAVYVGDTQGDADSCKEAQIPFIFAAYGFGSVPEAQTVIHSFSDLMTVLPEFFRKVSE